MKMTWWPTPQDYNEAIQIPRAFLDDPELRDGMVYTNSLGLPRAVTGSFASVYRIHCREHDYALRLFLRNIEDQEERYSLISEYVQHDDLPYTVTFDFLKHGIKVRNEWLPALKMQWVDGQQFDDYIVEHLANPKRLESLASKFLTMVDDMRAAGIAHGDLQHGNIIVWHDELRLVDYDGMFVPSMKTLTSSEIGHGNYQHPLRAASHFGDYIDNFSAWIIYASLRALAVDSTLLHQLGGGDDCLLFRKSDFIDPLNSTAFAAFEKHRDPVLNAFGRFIRQQLRNDLTEIPFLTSETPSISDCELPQVSQSSDAVRSGARLIRGALPEWIDQHAIDLSNESSPLSTTTEAQSRNPSSSWTVTLKSAQPAMWIKPGTQLIDPQVPFDPATDTRQVTQFWPAVPPQSNSPGSPVEWNLESGRAEPMTLQTLMILNPFVWALGPAAFIHLPTFFLLLAFNTLIEMCIWIPAKADQKAASNFVELYARVDDLREEHPTSVQTNIECIYRALLSYNINDRLYHKRELSLTYSTYQKLKRNTYEKILCDRYNPTHIVLYRTFPYHRVAGAAPISYETFVNEQQALRVSFRQRLSKLFSAQRSALLKGNSAASNAMLAFRKGQKP